MGQHGSSEEHPDDNKSKGLELQPFGDSKRVQRMQKDTLPPSPKPSTSSRKRCSKSGTSPVKTVKKGTPKKDPGTPNQASPSHKRTDTSPVHHKQTPPPKRRLSKTPTPPPTSRKSSFDKALHAWLGAKNLQGHAVINERYKGVEFNDWVTVKHKVRWIALNTWPPKRYTKEQWCSNESLGRRSWDFWFTHAQQEVLAAEKSGRRLAALPSFQEPLHHIPPSDTTHAVGYVENEGMTLGTLAAVPIATVLIGFTLISAVRALLRRFRKQEKRQDRTSYVYDDNG